ncbi:MAG TPA: lantibiotic dehydratase C-terminal domain-containing protein [Longimicrobium sp.]|nr:lantibiotic dehydratase C-terminal domain-containing protein [Longimicrobium sp.]
MHGSALNVYFWDFAEQNRLLTECVGPAVHALRGGGALEHFWFSRFDTRGPHLVLLLDPAASREEEVHAGLEAVLDAYLSRAPSTRVLDREELERRHAQCRGRHLCSLDLIPGVEPNNSYRWVDVPADALVLRSTPGMDAHAVKALLTDQALWSVDQLRAGGATATAVRWAAGLTAALERAGVDAATVWRAYASSLIPRFRDAIAAEDPTVVEGLPRLIGPGNVAVFDRLWDPAQRAEAVWAGMDALARAIAAATSVDERTVFVRRFTHIVLAQLDQFVRFRIPLALYAWYRTLPQPAAA